MYITSRKISLQAENGEAPKYGRAMDLLQPKWDIAYPADDITATCALVE
jgi:hypothetical protein